MFFADRKIFSSALIKLNQERFFMNENNISMKKNNFLKDFISGIAIGIAFIIPGFSGGSVAAILGIYERLVGSIADIAKDFKNSIKTLLPIGLGMVSGVIAMLYPLGWALEKFPFPTVSLFVGLALGGLPSITDKLKGKKRLSHLPACIIPLLCALLLSFLPVGQDVNLFGLTFGGYILLVIIGIIGSCALVIPGISGSMLLLILGYYNPVVRMITDHFFKGRDILTCILVLGSLAIGILIGFIIISKLMKFLLKNYPMGTYFAIIGFILGSIPTVYISTAKDAAVEIAKLSALHWVACVLMLIIGAAMSLSLVMYAKKKGLSE